jgi:hypothetical protein
MLDHQYLKEENVALGQDLDIDFDEVWLKFIFNYLSKFWTSI